MESLVKTPISDLLSAGNKVACYTVLSLMVIFMGLSFSSCESDPPACEMQNAGTFVVENNNSEGTLQVFFNKERVAVNGIGDLGIEPGQQGSMQLTAGKHKMIAILRISNCSGNRCSINSTQKHNSVEDLMQFESRNFVF